MKKAFRRFGRYFLLDQIGEGGMAEIFRARMAAINGPNRLLVIKQINNKVKIQNNFSKMFQAEIEVTSAFNHPNIVSVYDFGIQDENPYIAMEYIEGKDLFAIHSKVISEGHRLPIPIVLFIIEQTARSLQYAHNFFDKLTGDSRQVVHRDISPQNIIISYNGTVKVIDFGIAKVLPIRRKLKGSLRENRASYPPNRSRVIFWMVEVIFFLWELFCGKS